MSTLLQDLRFALRLLRRSPGFTAVAVGTLALAICANTVVFSILNSVILRPLNVARPENLYLLERGENRKPSQSYPDYLDLRDRNRSFENLAAFAFDQGGLDSGENPTRVWFYRVSGNYFDMLGIQPYLGRVVHPSDEHGPGSAPYIVLTHASWLSYFNGDPHVVGRTVKLNKHPLTITGVTPPGFYGTFVPFHPVFFVPMVNQLASGPELNDRGNRWVDGTIGRLKPGVTPAQAIADLNIIGADLKKNYPADEKLAAFTLGRPSLFGDVCTPAVSAFVAGLMLLAGLILVAACANLGSLFAARAADRSREIAVRVAVGAGRARIMRQFFTEALLVSLVGGAAGLWGAALLLGRLSEWQPMPEYPLHLAVSPDPRVYAVALLLTLASALLFGAIPVRQALHTDPYAIIKAGSTGQEHTRLSRRISARDLLLGAQIAICAVLVTSSLVAVRGMLRSLHSNFGFEPQNTLLVETDLGMGGYKTDDAPAMQKRMIEAMEAIPGVMAVGLSDGVPVGNGAGEWNVFTDQTTDLRPSNAATAAFEFDVAPGYFAAAQTALLMGRTFTWHDDKNAPRVAVVNQEFARRIFGSADKAMGSYYKMRDGARLQVVGIAQDGKYDSLTEAPQPAMFLPILQSPSSMTWLVVRSKRDPQQLAAEMRSRLKNLDRGLPVYLQTWYHALDGPLFGPRMATISLGVMGVIGAILAVTGIFGLAAYSVSKRKRELGIRIALGARRKEVLQAALGRAVKLLAIGSAAGLLLGILASRVLAFIVYQATSRDPLVLAGVVLAMALLGLVATWIPARRALAIEPAILMREE